MYLDDKKVIPSMIKDLTQKQRSIRRIIIITTLFVSLFIIFLIGCSIGKAGISFPHVIMALFHKGDPKEIDIVINGRLPRLFLALLVGIGMGAAGVIMQNLLHNDLASPGTLGVADGSSLFVTLYFAFLSTKAIGGPIALPILALIGGLISAFIIYLLGTKRHKPISPTKLIMTGVAMSAFYGAISTFLMYVLDENQLGNLQRWNAGDISSTIPWMNVLVLFIWILVFFSITMVYTQTLDVINLGYDTATGLGVNVKKSFIILSLLAVGMSSASVAFGGNFFFLGLIGPHIARRLVGTKTKYLIPASGAVSSIIIILANILVENVSIFANIPTGIFVSIIAVPYFLYLLIKSR